MVEKRYKGVIGLTYCENIYILAHKKKLHSLSFLIYKMLTVNKIGNKLIHKGFQSIAQSCFINKKKIVKKKKKQKNVFMHLSSIFG
jgi:hypothetical protein